MMGFMTLESLSKRLIDLIPSLENENCNVEQIDSGIRISYFDGQIFDIYELGGWIQVGSVILYEDELDDMPFRADVMEFVLTLNSRSLGCRFAFEPDGDLLIVEDIPLEKLDGNSIREAIDAISYVDYVFYDLILETGRSGVPPTEDEIDVEVTEKENAYERYH